MPALATSQVGAGTGPERGLMDLLGELRRRLDVPVDLVSDALLTHLLDVAGGLLQPWLVADAATRYTALVDEATLELAVKVYDVSARGAVAVDAVGDFVVPAPSATPGLVRSVYGVLGPALATGGLSV